MESQPGWQLRPEDFQTGFEKVDDLVYYDGPLMSHYSSPMGKAPHYIFKYVDQDGQLDRWLVMETSLPHLYDYLTNARSLRDILAQDYNRKVYVADADEAGDFTQVVLSSRTELLPTYLPLENSYYGLAMSDDYATYFETAAEKEIPFASYLARQRTQPVRLRLVPSDIQHATTVGAADIGSFLQKVTRSFRGYVEVRFEALFRALFSIEQAASALSRLLEESEPRAVNTAFGSFEIDLALDVLTLTGLPTEVVTWQRQALVEYQEDVLNFDFHSQGPLPERLIRANDDQLRAIFSPVVSIANSTSYVAQSRIEVTQPFKELKNVLPKDSRRVVPPKPRSVIDEEAETEFANVLLQWRKGQDLEHLTLKQLRQALIAVTTGDASVAQITEFTTSEGELIQLAEPIDVTLSKTGSFTEASYEPLAIKQLGANGGAALDAVYRELVRMYSTFQQQDRSVPLAGVSTRQQRITTAFAQLIGE